MAEMSTSADGSFVTPELSASVKKSLFKGNEGGHSSGSSTKSLHELDDKAVEPITTSSNAVNIREVESGLETYLEKLEAIHWENSSSSVANVLGQMLSTVNNLSSTLETTSPEHHNLQQEIQSELSQISELFIDYAERHPSICHDQAEAAAVFEQLQAIRQQQPLQAAGSTRKSNQKN